MRVLAEVITPGNGKSYDIILDDRLTVGAVKEKIIEQITSFENDGIKFSEQAALFSVETNTKLPDNRNLRKAGFRSGQTIILL